MTTLRAGWVIWLAILHGLVPAQTPSFRIFDLSNKLPAAQGKILFEDRSGKFWIGSDQGLLEFDGLQFYLHLRPDSGVAQVTALYEDLFRKLWVGYADGGIFNYTGIGLVKWMPEEGLPQVPIRGFVEDFERQLWIATYGEGLYVSTGKRLYNFNQQDDGLSADDIYCITRDRQGRIWVGTDQGISICTFLDEIKKVELLGLRDGLTDQIVRTLYPDARGNVWIGTYDHGVIRYQIATNSFDTHFLPKWEHGVVSSIELMEGRELWIGTETEGLWRYNLPYQKLEQIKHGLPDNAKITALQKDREGNLWVLNNTGQIFLSQRQFDFIPTPGLEVQAVLTTRAYANYIGTPSGLYAYQNQDSIWELLPGTQGINVISIYEDWQGKLWVGTFGQGLLNINPITYDKKWWTETEGLTNNAVLAITGVENILWVGTLGGITAYRINTLASKIQTELLYEDKLKKISDYIYHALSDSEGRIWFGTGGHGAFYWADEQMHHLEELVGPLDSVQTKDLKNVFSLALGSDSSLWLNGGHSIYRLKNNILEKKYQATAQKLITGIKTTHHGQLLAIENGLILLIHADDGSYTRYGQGLGIYEFEGNLNCISKDNYGNIFIGGNQQVIQYSSLRENISRKPATKINSITVQGIPIEYHDPLRLNYRQNQITINYSGLWYNNSTEVQFKYRLTNYDPAWRISRDHEASYANLSPGVYTFELLSAVDDQWTNANLSTLTILIDKPLWQKLWFIIIALAVAISAVFYIIKLRDRELQRMSRLETERAKSQLAAIQAQINPHFLFNSFNTLTTIIEEDPKIAVQYVEKMSDFYRSMLSVRDTELINLEEEIKLVQDYHFLLEKRFGKAIQLIIQLPAVNHHQFLIPLTLQLLVENAVKHNIVSKSKPLTVRIYVDDQNYLVVTNNRQPKQITGSTGFGLSSLIKRYELLNEQIIIEQPEDHFTVRIPLINKT